jgi:hypothetical protein
MMRHLGKCDKLPPHYSERINPMSKRVLVTYRIHGMRVIEECDLLEEEELEDVYLFDGERIIADMTIMFKLGVVLFRDAGGIFSLPPESIVKIEVL